MLTVILTFVDRRYPFIFVPVWWWGAFFLVVRSDNWFGSDVQFLIVLMGLLLIPMIVSMIGLVVGDGDNK